MQRDIFLLQKKWVNRLVLLFIYGLTIGLYLYATSCGILKTYDSWIYLRYGEVFLANGGNLPPGEAVFYSWPPLFGLILFLLCTMAGIEPVIINVFFLSLNFLALYILSIKYLSKPRERLLFLFVSSISVNNMMVHSFLWSEPFFIFLLIMTIITYFDLIENYRFYQWMIFIILFNLLCLQRNAGIFFLPAFIFVAINLNRDKKSRFFKTLILFGLSAASFIVWNVYTGFYLPEGISFFKLYYFDGFFSNLFHYSGIISAWFLPSRLPVGLRIIFLFLLLATAVAGIFRSSKNRRNGLLGCLFLIFGFYTFGMSAIGRIDPSEAERYLSVIYPVFILWLIIAMRGIVSEIQGKTGRIILYSALFIWISYIAARSINNVMNWHSGNCQSEVHINGQNTR